MAASLLRMEEQLMASGTPLSTQQRREIITKLMRETYAQMETLRDTISADQQHRIRGLTELVALRDRQLRRATSSPRQLAASPRQGLNYRPVLTPCPTSSSGHAGLFVTPSLSEAVLASHDRCTEEDVVSVGDSTHSATLHTRCAKSSSAGLLVRTASKTRPIDGVNAMLTMPARLLPSKSAAAWKSPFKQRAATAGSHRRERPRSPEAFVSMVLGTG